jgi:hypothetical protein
MSGPDAELVEMVLERVARVRDLVKADAARELRPAVVARESRGDHLVARDEIREHRLPVAPVAGEPVQEDHRLALPGAVQGR